MAPTNCVLETQTTSATCRSQHDARDSFVHLFAHFPSFLPLFPLLFRNSPRSRRGGPQKGGVFRDRGILDNPPWCRTVVSSEIIGASESFRVCNFLCLPPCNLPRFSSHPSRLLVAVEQREILADLLSLSFFYPGTFAPAPPPPSLCLPFTRTLLHP